MTSPEITTQPPHAHIAGLDWRFVPLDFGAQFEVELMLLGTFGAPAGAVLATAAAGFAQAIADVLAETAGEDFDLMNLIEGFNPRDPRLKLGLKSFIDAFGMTAGSAISLGSEKLFDRLDHRDVLRLAELCVIGKADVIVDGKPKTINDMRTWSRVCKRTPSAKWSIIFAALAVTYGGADEAEDEGGDA